MKSRQTVTDFHGATMSFWYVASPYSKYPAGQEAAFREAARATAILTKHGIPAYSPISHTHPLAEHGDIDPLDHAFWMKADEPFMRAAKGLIVLTMEGWKQSVGVQFEIDEFVKAGKPVIYCAPGEIPELPECESETCLQEAQRLVYGERGAAYGHPYDDYKRTVDAFNALTNATLTPAEGVLFMLCVKLSRAQHSPNRRDHYVDLAGYAECLYRVQERQGG